MHQPVLAQEILSLFEGCSLGVFVDGTIGAGGHAQQILQAHPEIQKFYALDRDLTALEISKETLQQDAARIEWIHTEYIEMQDYVAHCDGVLLDLGVSSMQLDQAERGFSFYKDGPLDMRMDQTERVDAKLVVNTYSEKKLGEIFRDYGEERRWRAAAKAICEARHKREISTTLQLTKILEPVVGWSKRHHHPATRIFQAIRMEVNQELQQIEQGILAALECLNPKGRLVVITFHSLEDRIVKHLFKAQKNVNILTKKPITASKEEQRKNPRSRSAKVRCIEKCLED